MAEMRALVREWIDGWERGNYRDLPLADEFRHTSPYGTIVGRKSYLDLVEANREQFLGYRFEIHDELYDKDKACVRYTGTHEGFVLEVSEWYFARAGEIVEVVAYFNVGEISEEQRLVEPE